MLVLDTPLDDRLAPRNCLVFEFADGTRVRVWLTPRSGDNVRAIIEAPKSVVITRGKLVGEGARGPAECKR